MSTRLAVLAGARPNFMKGASLMTAIARDGVKPKLRESLGSVDPPFCLVTLHRRANVDVQGKLDEIVDAPRVISEELPPCWAVHPRTRASFSNGGLNLFTRIRLLDLVPLGRQRRVQVSSGDQMMLCRKGS